ncbi:MAG: arylsulfatase [Planctomycetota bacterium]|nr:arylsulfatase [Planctomycetota bacterium]
MKTLCPIRSVAIALFASAVLGACGEPAPLAHPNVVLIVADDLGFGDVAWTNSGSPNPIPTPNLDRLAAAGVVLDQFRTAPLCTPARAAILTGRAPARLGLLRNISAKDSGGLDPRVATLPETLRAAGYATELVGKWHLGHASAELRPTRRGFEHFLGLLGGWIDYQTHARGAQADWWRDESPLVQEGHSTRLLAEEAVRAIRERDPARPLYLHLAFNAPHAPTSVPPGRSVDEVAGQDPVRRQYALLVDELDRGVGRVLDALEKERIRGQTLVVFVSDNGAPAGYGGSNGKLREGKGTVYDGGLRVPAIVSWPGRLASGRSALMANAVDLVPTLCAAAGVDQAPDALRDGVSLWPALASAAAPPHRIAVFGVERADGSSWAAFDGRWKLVVAADAPRAALFDVLADPGESRDRAAVEPEVAAQLEIELAPWRALPHLPFVGDEGPQRGPAEAQRGTSGDASK